MSSVARKVAITCLESLNTAGSPPKMLFLDPDDDYYSDLSFGTTRLEVPQNFHVYSYLSGAARYYYLPGFLKLAVISGNDAADLVQSLLDDLTEPNMLAGEDRFEFWSFLLDCSEQERVCISNCIPVLEEILGEFSGARRGWDAERRASFWGNNR